MPDAGKATTVRALWELALGSRALLRGGKEGLDGPVVWVTALRPTYPLFPDLDQGHLAMASPEVARRLDSSLSLSYLIRELAHARAAGLVVDESPDAEARALADTLALPLFEMPDGTDLRQLEREVLRSLLDREGYEARRAAEWRQQYQDLLSKGGMTRVVQGLAADLGVHVQLVDTCGTMLAQADVGNSQSTLFPGNGDAYPVLVAGKRLGTLHVSEPTQPFPLLAVAASQAAEVCGLEMLQECVRRETEDQLGAGLAADILDPSVDRASIAARLARQGYELSPGRRHVALALASAEEVPPAILGAMESDLRFIGHQADASVLSLGYQTMSLYLVSMTGTLSEARLREWLSQAAEPATRHGYSVGVGRVVSDASGLRLAVQQAMATAAMGSDVARQGGLLFYGDLGLYRLLLGLRDQVEVQRFYDEMLAPLISYDVKHNTELLPTLRAYFEQNTNASETARILYVHRNTLNYRLQRISEITGLDLDNADTRLALQVALRIHYLST